MVRSLPSALAFLIATLAVLPVVHAQEMGGPYDVDENTVLLMHFDGDVTNASDLTADGFLSEPITLGTENGEQDFFAEDIVGPGESFGQAIHFDNTFTADVADCTANPGSCEYLAVPDDDDLDLTGDWTIELWFKAGQSGGPANIPAPIIKPAHPDSAFNFANYRTVLYTGSNKSGEVRAFYKTQDGAEDAVMTPAEVVTQGTWYHIAYIRDTAEGKNYVVIRDADLNLVDISASDITGTPITTDDSLFIGAHPYDKPQHFEGDIDEVRISNIVRSGLIPASTVTLANVTSQLINQPVGQATAIAADVEAVGAAISSVTLNYRIDGGAWEAVAMMADGEATYSADIPALNTVGSDVEYFVEAELASGKSAMAPEEAVATETYYGYVTTPSEELVLDLSFDEGAGVPNDASSLAHVVEVHGTPEYREDAAEGNYSMYFEGDSSFLRIDPSPHLALGEFTIDFWFKADEFEKNDRFVVKEGGDGVTNLPFQMNYQVFHQTDGGIVRGASLVQDEGLNGGQLELPNPLNTGEWYRAIYQLTADTAFVQIRNSANEVVQQVGYGSISHPATKTMGPFHIAHFTGNDLTYYNGAIDGLKIYNYAADIDGPVETAPAAPTGLMASQGPIGVDLSWDANTEPDLAGYRLYRGMTSGFDTTGALIASVEPTFASYKDMDVTSGQTYYYALVAVDAEGNVSDLSSEASVTLGGGSPDETVGGPYTADENTVVLLHFEDDFANESDSTADAVAYGDPVFEESVMPELGQAVHFDNLGSVSGDCRDADSDCQFATIADTAALDLDADWTMETWVRIDDWSQGFPRLLHKIGSPVYYSNYYLAPNSNGYLRAGYYHGNGWHNHDTDSLLTTGAWYHFMYIRDTERSQTLVMVHDQDRNLVGYSAMSFPEGETPYTTDEPLFIGVNPANDNMRLIGSMDEVRISNVVREYQGVQLAFIDNVTTLASQQPGVPSYTVTADVDLYGAGAVSAVLYYSTGDGWEQVAMTPTQGTTYTADIPQQAPGSTVEYYVEAQVDGEARATSATQSFQILLPVDEVLALHFDDGAVPPTDSSAYADEHVISVVGNAAYSSDAAEGDSSFVLDGETYIELASTDPLVVERATVDLWFNADEIPADSTRLIVKQGETDWAQNNYEVYFDDGGILRAGSILQGNDRDLSEDLVLDSAITAGEWYRAVYMVTGDAASLQLFDAEGALVDHAVTTHGSTPKLAGGPLRIGHADGEDLPFFTGKVDRVVVSNYPAVPGPFVIEDVTQLVNQPSTMTDYYIYADIAHAGSGDLTAILHYPGRFGWGISEMKRNDEGLYEGNITSQEAGTVVPYYVTVSAADDLYEASMPEDANQDSTYYSFGVFEPGTQVLDLDFEEGEGVPMDASMYAAHNVVELHSQTGTLPTYTEDAASGTYAMQFSQADSNWVEINSSFLASEEFTVDFWFKPDEVDHNDRLVIKEGPGLSGSGSGQWWQPNYQVFIHQGTIRGASIIQDSGLNGGPLDLPNDTLEAGKWYHAIYELTADSAFVQLRDSSDAIIQEIGAPQDGPAVKTVGPFRIGHSDGDDGSYFSGLVDRVRVFNYPVTGTPASLADVTAMPHTVDVDDAPYVITAEASKAAGALDVALHYQVNQGDWVTVAMEHTEGDTYAGEIPQQPLAARVDYYVEATDDFGNTIRMPETDAHTFFVGQAETMALQLSFEEGQGQPVDSTVFGHEVTLVNEPTYTTETLMGEYAMQFSAGDSSYLEIAEAPFLASEEFTLDFWMRADSIVRNARAVIKEGGAGRTGAWWQPNYQVFLFGTEGETRGASYICNDEESCGLNGGDSRVEDVIEAGVWYHVLYQAKEDSTIFQVRAATGDLLGEARVAVDGAPVPTMGPFRIAHGGDVDNEYFIGAIDEVRFYNYAGALEQVITDTEEESVPTEFALRQNYPNPFNPSTNIEFDLPKHAKVRLDVFNVLGRKVATLVDGDMPAGKHKVTFEASGVASGVYFYRIEAGDHAAVRKMVLVK